MKNILENNKLIAEFMGGKLRNESRLKLAPQEIWLPSQGVCRYDTIETGRGKTLQYHKSWDWLMPVVEKIEILGYYTSIRLNKYTNKTTVCTIEDTNEATIGGGLSQILVTEGFKHLSKIEAVYNAVVEFIKWYNKQK